MHAMSSPHKNGSLRCAILIVQVLLAMAGSRREGDAHDHDDTELSALWFYRAGVALQVADDAGSTACLRAFRAAARILSDTCKRGASSPPQQGQGQGQGDVAQVQGGTQLYELVQNASREVFLREKARRVGGTLVMGAEIHDGVGAVALQWVLGDDLRDVADLACCVDMQAGMHACQTSPIKETYYSQKRPTDTGTHLKPPRPAVSSTPRSSPSQDRLQRGAVVEEEEVVVEEMRTRRRMGAHHTCSGF